MTEKPLAFLELVKVLETAVGYKTKYALLEPFPCQTIEDGKPAIIAIQNAGKIIAQHAGLNNLTFIISVTTHPPSTAGHIELNHNSKEVFIELSHDVCPYKDAVLAVLCHEISHKFLHSHGIRHGNVPLMQEYLTEVTAVYLGMGKIMLNGSQCENERTKERLTTGYISNECFAFVYRLICEMRKIPSQQALNGLSAAAREILLSCDNQYRGWFAPKYTHPEGIQELHRDLLEGLLEAKTTLAKHEFLLRRAERKTARIRRHLRDSHTPLLEADRKLGRLMADNSNPHLKYLDCLEARELIYDLTSMSERQTDVLRAELEEFEEFNESEPNNTASFEIVECPMDGKKLRLPAGRKRLLVTCSVCNYKFLVDTSFHLDNTSPSPTVELEPKSSFLKTFKAAFGRK